MSTLPGPGDPETWGPPTGHPHDPRTDGEELPMPGCELCGDPAFWWVDVEPATTRASAYLCASCSSRYVGGLLEIGNPPATLAIRQVDDDDALDPPEPDYEQMWEDRR